MSNEIWKVIEDYPNYEVSTLGRVRNRETLKLMTPCKNKIGYMLVNLSTGDNKNKTPYVHRLVAKAFIENPENLPQINHKDEDKTNNSVENLEWCTSKFNLDYGTRIERQVETRKRGNKVNFDEPMGKVNLKNASPVQELYTGYCFPSIRYASYFFQLSRNSIATSLRENREVAGLKWVYLK